MFYNSSNNFEYNDCVSRGACSVSPTISSMQEVMFIVLRQIAYYLVKLKDFNVKKENIEKNNAPYSSFISELTVQKTLQKFKFLMHFLSSIIILFKREKSI